MMQTCIIGATYVLTPDPVPEGTVIATFARRE
jgi:hypothetical protein